MYFETFHAIVPNVNIGIQILNVNNPAMSNLGV
jgi:hypothetical protein